MRHWFAPYIENHMPISERLFALIFHTLIDTEAKFEFRPYKEIV